MIRHDLRKALEHLRVSAMKLESCERAEFFRRLGNRYIVCENEAIYSVTSNFTLRERPRKIKPCITKGGYHQVTLKVDKTNHYLKVHRIVAELFLGLDHASSLQVHHKDFDPANNHVGNLEIVTARVNTHRSMEAGRRDRSRELLDAVALAL